MNTMKKAAAVASAMLMLCSTAVADSIRMNGETACIDPVHILAPASGRIVEVYAAEGDTLSAGDMIAEIATDKVYAQSQGTVYYFGSVGESAERITKNHGGIAVIEPEHPWIIQASTYKAYNKNEARIVHPDQSVYFQVKGRKETAYGHIIALDESMYTVEVTSGTEVKDGDVVSLYSDEECTRKSQIGQGRITRAPLDWYSGTGLLYNVHGKSGDQVKPGDLLFETADMQYEGIINPDTTVRAGHAGVLAHLYVGAGTDSQEGMQVAEVWPFEDLRIRAYVSEIDFSSVHVGDRVRIQYDSMPDEEAYGTVEKIMAMTSDDASRGTEYETIILPDSTENLVYNLHASVYLNESAGIQADGK